MLRSAALGERHFSVPVGTCKPSPRLLPRSKTHLGHSSASPLSSRVALCPLGRKFSLGRQQAAGLSLAAAATHEPVLSGHALENMGLAARRALTASAGAAVLGLVPYPHNTGDHVNRLAGSRHRIAQGILPHCPAGPCLSLQKGASCQPR
eukprot:450589-Pelagomonas_calceolata.AAC.3